MKLLCACFIIATLAASESDALKLAVATDQMASSDLGSKSAINGTLCDKDPSFHPEMNICCDGMIYPISDSTAPSNSTYACCGKDIYYMETEICCSGTPAQKTSENMWCCGSTAFDNTTMVCCGSDIKDMKIGC